MRVWLCALAEDSTLRFYAEPFPVSNRNKLLTGVIVSPRLDRRLLKF